LPVRGLKEFEMWRFVEELVGLVFFFLVARSALSALWTMLRGGDPAPNPSHPAPRQTAHGEIPTSGELRKDPVCGTFVATTTVYTAASCGDTVYFCSKECRDKYQSNQNGKRWGKSTSVRS
jgi:YHS domain-containing protein